MLQAGVHFGHQSSRWHPKMESHIFAERGGIHIVNLEDTQKQLASALEYVKGIAARGGVILFLGTKRQAQDIVKKYAVECGMPYVTERWLGGTITNFKQVSLLIKKYKDDLDKQKKGEFRKYTKKEQIWKQREIEELDRKVGGIQTLDRIPDALFIVDIRTEKTALMEAKTKSVKVIAICDTNVNPTLVDRAIPANDDAVKSIEMMTRLIAEAINEGKREAGSAKAAPEVAAPAPAEPEEEVAVIAEAKAHVEELDLKLHEETVAAKQDEIKP